jgi:hypothetical protein
MQARCMSQEMNTLAASIAVDSRDIDREFLVQPKLEPFAATR